MPMTEQTAHEIYDILEEHAGADEHWRENFVYHQTHDNEYFGPCDEYRFQGDLGFGGKFWRTHRADPVTGEYPPHHGEVWWVNCYNEDLDRIHHAPSIIEATNAALSELRHRLLSAS